MERSVASEALERIRAIATPILEFAGMELVHLEMKRDAGGWILRLYIDKEAGVTLDDCSRISRQLSAQLDLEDPIPQRYTLEVSSPGLDRPLVTEKDFSRFAGRRVRLSTLTAVDGQRNFTGRLVGFVDGSVRLALEGDREVAIARDNVAKARLEIEL
ncbi:MAG TPA: ribosome maturation factor RimP [Candidatus Polarisedimenticolia bacterium]